MKKGPGPGLGPAATFVGKFDGKSVSINPSVTASSQNPIDADSNHDAFRVLDQRLDLEG